MQTQELKQQMLNGVRLLLDSGVMQHSAHGNISARLDHGRLLMSSHGDLRSLHADGIAVVSLEGELLDGELEPATAEIVPMHSSICRAREGTGAVIHTHSPHATAFALAHEPLRCAYEPLLRHGADLIPLARWAPRGSAEAVKSILSAIAEHPNAPAVLLANHGLLAFGPDPREAARLVRIVEEAAEVTLHARRLGGEHSFPDEALERERKQMAAFGSRP